MWAAQFCMIMVSVSSITEQLCKQKLEDGWTSSESERRAGVAFSGCPAAEGEGKENTTAGHSTLCGFDESKLNNNIRGVGAAAGPAGNGDEVVIITKDCDWYTSQVEQMPPVKKHRRSFSIPGGTRSDTSGLELRHIQHSQSTLNTAVLRPVAVRPRLAAGLRDASRERAVTAATKSSSFSPYPFSISGSSSGFYRHPATDFVGAAPPRGGFRGSGFARSVGMAAGRPMPETAFSFSTDVRQPTDGVRKDFVPSLDLSSIRSGPSLIGSRSPSLVISSNSDLTLLCKRSSAPKQCPLRTPERKTGLKRRRDDDRPTLDFFKMIETAYEREFCSSSISQQTTGSKGRFKSDVCSQPVNQTPNVDCSSPCSLLDSTETRGASPASPFISLHRHFLADETDRADAGDDDTAPHVIGRRNATTECNSDQSKENWRNMERTLDNGDRILLGSEFDLDLIENN